MIITSPDNERLKLVRRLARRRHRDREGLFVAEGEDLLEAARAAGAEPVELLTAAGAGLGGAEVEPDLLAGVSSLGSGARAIGVWRQRWAEEIASPAVYLHGLSDPGNVGTIVRTSQALGGGCVVLGPGSADPYGPKAVRASMGAVFATPLARAGLAATPRPRVALVAHGGRPPDEMGRVGTLCLGSEREGLPAEVISQCQAEITIPLRSEAESLNVGAAAAIALQRISSPAGAENG